jgi:predicted Zn-dependent peptidase
MSFVVVGDFKKEKVLNQLTKLFEKMPFKKPLETPVVEIDSSVASGRTFIKKPVELAYFAIGRPTVGFGSPDVIGLDLLADVLGGGASARLYQKLREETQTVLSIACDYIPFQQKGLFSFFGETTQAKAQEALWRVTELVDDVRENPVTPAELARAKARIKSEWLHGCETPHGQATTLGSLSVLGHTDLINTYISQIDSLTPDDVMDIYHRHLEGQIFTITMLEPESASV